MPYGSLPHCPSLYFGWAMSVMLPIHEVVWFQWVHDHKRTESLMITGAIIQCRWATWGLTLPHPIKAVRVANRRAALEELTNQHDYLLSQGDLKKWKVFGLEVTVCVAERKVFISAGFNTTRRFSLQPSVLLGLEKGRESWNPDREKGTPCSSLGLQRRHGDREHGQWGSSLFKQCTIF